MLLRWLHAHILYIIVPCWTVFRVQECDMQQQAISTTNLRCCLTSLLLLFLLFFCSVLLQLQYKMRRERNIKYLVIVVSSAGLFVFSFTFFLSFRWFFLHLLSIGWTISIGLLFRHVWRRPKRRLMIVYGAILFAGMNNKNK